MMFPSERSVVREGERGMQYNCYNRELTTAYCIWQPEIICEFMRAVSGQ